MDLTASAAPRSDQMNSDDLISGPRTFTVDEVTPGSDEQPVNIHLAEFPHGRPFRPSKSMIRVLIHIWGPDSTVYTGRRMTLYRDPEVTFGKDKVGGIRISHLSHLDKPRTMQLTVTRGKRRPYEVKPLPDTAPTSAPIDEGTVTALADLRAEWHTATPERRTEIEAEVARLTPEAGQ